MENIRNGILPSRINKANKFIVKLKQSLKSLVVYAYRIFIKVQNKIKGNYEHFGKTLQ